MKRPPKFRILMSFTLMALLWLAPWQNFNICAKQFSSNFFFFFHALAFPSNHTFFFGPTTIIHLYYGSNNWLDMVIQKNLSFVSFYSKLEKLPFEKFPVTWFQEVHDYLKTLCPPPDLHITRGEYDEDIHYPETTTTTIGQFKLAMVIRCAVSWILILASRPLSSFSQNMNLIICASNNISTCIPSS